MRAIATAGLVAMSAFGASRARADVEAAHVFVEVDGDARGCPSESAFADAVAERLGKRVDVAPRETAAVRVRFLRDGALHRASVTVASGEGERELRATGCAEVAQKAALVVALALDDAAAPATPPPAPIAAPRSLPEEARPEPPRVAPRAEAAPPAERDSNGGRSDVGLSFAMLGGVLPQTAPVGALVAARRFGSWGLELGAFATTTTEARDARGVGVAAALYGARLGPCWLLRVELCAEIHGGVMRARGVGVVESARDEALVVLGVARASYPLPLSKDLALRPDASLLAPLVRPVARFGEHDAFTPSRLGGSLGISLLARGL